MIPIARYRSGKKDPAFPVFVGGAESEHESSVTSHTVSLPTNQDGDLIVLLFSDRDPANTITWPGGWTKLADFGNAAGVSVAYKIADGEPSTITVTTSSSQPSAHIGYCFRNAYEVPEIASKAQGNSTTPNPPSLTPSWGLKNCYWIAMQAADDGSSSNYVSVPSGYTQARGIGAGVHFMTACIKQLRTATEDPGSFTINNSGSPWVANTIGIRGKL
jgi:hypothetical protein